MASNTLSILCFNKTHFVDVLESKGHRVVVAGVPEEHCPGRFDGWSQLRVDLFYQTDEDLSGILSRLPQGFVPDRIVYFDDSRPTFRVRGLERSPCPVIFYCVDAHVHHLWQPQMCGVFDAVLVAQKDHVEAYREYCSNARWFPLWAPEIPEAQEQRDIDVCFRGGLDPNHRPERVRFIDALKKEVPLDARGGAWQEAFTRAKIVLNESINSDVNFRVFEGLASGAMLLTPETSNGLSDLFKDRSELVMYKAGNVADAAKKILHYLSNVDEREQIARAGLQAVKLRHSASFRGAEFEEILRKLSVTDRPNRRYSAAYGDLFRLLLDRSGGAERERKLLLDVCQNLSELVRRGDRIDYSLVFMVERCKSRLFALGDFEPALSLLQDAMIGIKEAPIYRLLYINALHGAGKDLEAIEVARSISDEPESFVTQSEELVRGISEQSIFHERHFPKY